MQRIYEPEGLLEAAHACALRIAQGAPLALAAIKEVLRETETQDLTSAYQTLRSPGLKAYPAMLRSEDALEGPLAFSQKRPPAWKAR